MRRLYYSSGSFYTGDAVAKAVLRYAGALADTHTAAIIAIPVLTDGGRTGHAHLLVGPASQLFSMPADIDGDDPFDAEIVEDLERKTRALLPSRPQAQAPDALDLEDFEMVWPAG
ncbi:MAG: hypothetical protein ABWX65_02210 [Mycetocola sp.]